MISVTDVTLSLNETFQWVFSGLNVNILQCNVDPIDILVQSESRPNHAKQLVENPEILIHNSSFSSLDLKPGSKAQITDCYIDAQFKSRPTLITANNSDVSIQNCHFTKFINENGSTILCGHYYSHVIIEKSVFVQHNSSMGVLFLQNNCNMFINNATYSYNVASSPGYSAISLQDGIYAVMINTVFNKNSALRGGTVIARFKSKIALTNCTFSSNKAITGTTLKIFKNLNLKRSSPTLDPSNNGTFTPILPTLFNQTSSDNKKHKVIVPYFFQRSPTLKKKNSVQEANTLDGTYPGYGGAIYVDTQSQLFMTNCIFQNNSAQSVGGTISADSNVTLHMQETTFVGNKAKDAGAILAGLNVTLIIEDTTFVGNAALRNGGAIVIEQEAHLQMANCTLHDNIAELIGGAITAGTNVTLEIQETNFIRNSAPQGGAIEVDDQTYLRLAHCLFQDNLSQQFGGAVCIVFNSRLKIEKTNFTGNSALYGGTIFVQYQSYLRTTYCIFDNNISTGVGGAITASYDGKLDIQETKFTGNRAAVQGGAIHLDQQCYQYLRTTDCTFKDNHAENIGGAIIGEPQAVLEINRSYFSNNSASLGGAIIAHLQANLSLTNCRLERNVASDMGGAIATGISVKLKIQETNFTGNGASHNGGALWTDSLTDCHVVQSVFNRNTAKGSGGAVHMEPKSLIQLENTNFINNNAHHGGAINVQVNSNIQINTCSFWKNFGKKAGGALVIEGCSRALIESCHFLSNHAVNGGAVNINDPEHVAMHSTSFLRNVASYGGAIVICFGTSIAINNITCVGNQGLNGGGCLYIESVILTLNNSDISENIANHYGAGVVAFDSRIQVGISLTNKIMECQSLM